MRLSNSFRVNNVEKCTTKLKPGGLGGGALGKTLLKLTHVLDVLCNHNCRPEMILDYRPALQWSSFNTRYSITILREPGAFYQDNFALSDRARYHQYGGLPEDKP